MGTWSTDSFGNDTACDWAYQLEEVSDLTLVREAIDRVISSPDFLDASDAEEAIAAVEVIARLKGNFGEVNAYTEATDNWVRANRQKVPADLAAASGRALDRILTAPSEVLEQWQESDEFEKWKTAVMDLKKRAIK